jgi:ribonuclease PH
VLEADGGTRTLCITAAFVALADAIASIQSDPPITKPVLLDSVAAVSVGLIDGKLMLDLNYAEDSRAEVDMNVVMTGRGELVEVQGTAEGRTFSRSQLIEQLDLAEAGLARLRAIQREALGAEWPLD